jgi:anti-anti-sigma regulatory factor
MLSSKSMNQKFNELKFLIEKRDKQSIKMEAHGGFSVLFVYHPNEEKKYLERIKQEYPDAYFIDIAQELVEYIDSVGYDNFIEAYEEYLSEPEKLFKSESSESDLFKRILNKIQKAGSLNKLPILIRTGAFLGTGIENISIMDSNVVQELPMPLILMYPATLSKDNKLKFLNFRIASDYRATVIY